MGIVRLGDGWFTRKGNEIGLQFTRGLDLLGWDSWTIAKQGEVRETLKSKQIRDVAWLKAEVREEVAMQFCADAESGILMWLVAVAKLDEVRNLP